MKLDQVRNASILRLFDSYKAYVSVSVKLNARVGNIAYHDILMSDHSN